MGLLTWFKSFTKRSPRYEETPHEEASQHDAIQALIDAFTARIRIPLCETPPATFDDALDYLFAHCDDESRDWILSHPEPCNYHHTWGQYLRNTWKLWERKTPLSLDMQKRFGIVHGDDLSSVIVDTLWQRIRGEKETPQKSADRCIAHWKKYGADPFEDAAS